MSSRNQQMLAEDREDQWLGKRLPRPTALLAQLGPLAVHSHQFVDPDGKTYRITSRTAASVEASGSIAATRGRNLATKGLGALLVPGGAFVFGNARIRLHDTRELLFIVEDPSWHYVVACHPDASPEVHELATAVRRAASLMDDHERQVAAINAGDHGPTPQLNTGREEPAESSVLDPLSRLAKLADLRDRGALTEPEFEAAKATILRDL